LTWRGAWLGSTAYAINDAVHYNGSAYVAVAASTNQAPGNGGAWSLLAQKGDQGPAGNTIIEQAAFYLQNCIGGPCPVDFLLYAACPAGYRRLSLKGCHNSTDLVEATAHSDPYNQDALGCRFEGFVELGNPEVFATSMWCIAITSETVEPQNDLPFIQSISPATGPAGTVVTITGINFVVGSTMVLFSNRAAPGTCSTTTTCTVTSPAGLTGTVNVRIVTRFGATADTPADNYTYP
jgi:hypothetical protein